MSRHWGERLAQVIRFRRQTLRSVAQAVGCSIQAVHKWRRGGDIDHQKLQRLSEHLQVHWLWLKYGMVGVPHDEIVEADVSLKMPDLVRVLLSDDHGDVDAAIDSLGIGIIEFDLVTGSGYWSPTLRQMLGVDDESAFSRDVFRRSIHPADLAGVEEALRQAIISKNTVRQTFRLSDHYAVEFILRIRPIVKGDRVIKLFGTCWRRADLYSRNSTAG